MTRASPCPKPVRQLQAAYRWTSASCRLVVSLYGTGRPMSPQGRPRRPSRRVRFSEHPCSSRVTLSKNTYSSKCCSCKRFKMGQRSLVIEKRLGIFEFQIEKTGEVLQHMRELFPVRGVGAQCGLI